MRGKEIFAGEWPEYQAFEIQREKTRLELIRGRWDQFRADWDPRRYSEPQKGTLRSLLSERRRSIASIRALAVPRSARGMKVDPGFIHVQRITAAANLTPPILGMYVARMRMIGGGAAGAGALKITYAPPESAVIPVGASGLDATGAIGLPRIRDYFFRWSFGSTSFPSGSETFLGGLSAAEITFCQTPDPFHQKLGVRPHRLSDFRAVAVTGNETGTGGTARTYTLDVQPGRPVALLVMIAVATGGATGLPQGNVALPAIGQFTEQVEAFDRGEDELEPTPLMANKYEPASSYSLTHTCSGLGGATTVQIMGVLSYVPELPKGTASGNIGMAQMSGL